MLLNAFLKINISYTLYGNVANKPKSENVKQRLPHCRPFHQMNPLRDPMVEVRRTRRKRINGVLVNATNPKIMKIEGMFYYINFIQVYIMNYEGDLCLSFNVHEHQ